MREKLILRLMAIITTSVFGFFLINITAIRASIIAETPEDIGKLLNCMPPPTIGCTDQQAYNRLVQILQQRGLTGSEIANDQLVTCGQEMQIYQQVLTAYNTCPTDQKIPASNEADVKKYALPLLCPIFLEGRGSYNTETTKCECGNNYLLYGNQCQTPLEICRQKYGNDTLESAGTCNCQRGYSWNDDHTVCLQNLYTPTPVYSTKPQPSFTPATFNRPKVFKSPTETIKVTPTREPAITLGYVSESPMTTPVTTGGQENVTINWFSRMINSITNFLGKIFFNGR